MGWARQARFNEASQAGTDATPQHAVLYGPSPADFGKLIADDTEKWVKVVRAANIKPE
jgi:hypothetical protein